MHQTFCRTLCLCETGRRVLCELSVSVQLESTRKTRGRKKCFKTDIQNCRENATKKECKNLKRFGFVLQLSKWMQLNWKFAKLVWDKTSANLNHITNKTTVCKPLQKRKAKQKRLVYISMHFYKVFFLYILPFSTSAISFLLLLLLVLLSSSSTSGKKG